MINAQDLTQLIGAYKKRPEGKAMVMPQVDGVAGKPVILSADLREQMLASTAQVDVDGWRTVHSDLVSDFVSPNKRYRIDIGSPDEIARFEASTGHRLSWPASLMQTADAG
jgi:CTP:molybdopterin cytidylyltransferase MocA